MLRQLAQPPRLETRARERASRRRLRGAGGAVAVLLSRRGVRGVLKRPPMALLTPPVGPRDHALGTADAPVTLVEYGDFECPFCGRAYPELKRVLRRLKGKIRFVFRHFPLTAEHPHAQHAAEVAEAAAAQGKFWEMHDLLYQRQAGVGDEALVRYARELGLDAERVRRQLVAHVHAPRGREDFVTGTKSGLRATA